jgi:hypothetical protein
VYIGGEQYSITVCPVANVKPDVEQEPDVSQSPVNLKTLIPI